MTCAVHEQAEATATCARCGVAYCEDCLVTLRDQRVCAGCKDEVVRDVISGATVTGLPLARITARGVAWLVDHAALWIAQYGFTRFLTYFRWKFGLNLIRIPLLSGALSTFAIALLFFIYEGVMVAGRGQTLGKMLLRVRVVGPDGSPASRRQAWLRASVRVASVFITLLVTLRAAHFSPMAVFGLFLLDYLPGVLTPQRTTLHDLLARTRVVRVEP